MSPLKQQTTCKLDITYYPFDSQVCVFTFGLWTATENEVNVSFVSERYVPEKDKLLPNGELNVKDITVVRRSTYYPNTGLSFSDIQYTLHMERRTKYYITSLITPSFLLGVLGVLDFLLPAAYKERVGFCVTTLLSLIVLLLVVTEQIPKTSDSSLIISRFLEIILASLTAALVVSSLTLKFLFEEVSKTENIPWFVRVFTIELLGAMMLVNCSKFVRREKLIYINGKVQTTLRNQPVGNDLDKIVEKIRDMDEADECKAVYITAAKIERALLCT